MRAAVDIARAVPASALRRAGAQRCAASPRRAASSRPATPVAAAYSETIEVELTRPMGLALNSGREESGAYVAEVIAGGNAAKDGTIKMGDVLVKCGPEGTDVAGSSFDDIMDRLALDPDLPTMRLTLKRFDDGPNKSKPEGYVWLEANALNEDVTVLPSGLQYKVLAEGSGAAGRIKTDTACSCHYEGRLLDGTVFDSSYKRGKPITFAPRQVIKGWTEAMQLMKEGDKWELYVPAELGYGGRGSPSGSIAPGDALIFEIEIVQVMG